ncbi:MAG: VgrG-related protein [Roseiflexaceae bacterium]
MTNQDALINFAYLKINGTAADQLGPTFYQDLSEVKVESSLQMPDLATFTIHDAQLQWVDHAAIMPGNTLEIQIKNSVQVLETLFDGEIVEVEPSYTNGDMLLTVRAMDRMHRLMRGRSARTFLNVKASDVFSKVVQSVGLQAVVDSTTEVHAYIIQSNETNLELVQRLATDHGMLIYAEGKKIHFKKLATGDPVATLKWNETLGEFRPRMSTLGQVTEVSVSGWDVSKKQAVLGKKSAPENGSYPAVGLGKHGAKLTETAFGEAKYQISDRVIRSQKQAELLAQSVLNRINGGFIEAEGSAGGDPKILAGVLIKIENIGTRFSGNYYVTAATHTYNRDIGYETRFSVSGMTPNLLLTKLVGDQDAKSGTALVVGIITNIKDPDNLGRVKVKFPWLSESIESNWARVVSMGAGANRGWQIMPEVNDEVLVGFEHGDMNHPYVIGGLWNGQDAAIQKPDGFSKQDGKVTWRGFKSTAGHQLSFEEASDSKQIQIKTAGGFLITLNDKDKLIEVKTSKHTIKLDDQGNAVSIDSGGDFTLNAKGAVTIKSTGKCSVEGTAGVSVKSNASLSIESNAALDVKSNASLSMQGMATAELKSSGILTVQGTLVKIN